MVWFAIAVKGEEDFDSNLSAHHTQDDHTFIPSVHATEDPQGQREGTPSFRCSPKSGVTFTCFIF